MTGPRTDPPDGPGAAQALASDPAASAWVTANAGSGKTKVLIDRVARLLLGSDAPGGGPADPSRILCLTYTRAAAANMLNKLFAQLGEWALMDDPRLREALAALQKVEAVEDARLPAARRLFAQALETPGGLKIQTIHAFCESLLRRFPLEAGLSPHFTLLDEIGAQALLREARDRVFARALSGEDPALSAAVERVTDAASEDGIDALVADILKRREAFAAPPEEIAPRLCAALEVEAEEEAGTALAAFDAALPVAAILRLARAFSAAGGKTEQPLAPALLAAFETGDAAERLAALRAAVLKADGAPRATGRFPTKDVRAEDPGALDLVIDLQFRLEGLDARLNAIRARDDSLALARFARAALAEIDALKTARDALDFDDLIRRAGALLTRADARDWVRYKLDGGVDHILVDEAQDTSPAQWTVIAALAEEFFAGEGARSMRRTLFVVGDEKQSIYSFQGADPRELDRMRAQFEALTQGALRQPRLLHSFRSAPAVLEAVDRVFAQEQAAEGLTGAESAISHIAHRRTAPGRVEYWPPATPFSKAEDAPWWTPVNADPPEAPHLRLAEAIAARIAAMLGGERLPARGRRIRPGDILILVRRRDRFADAMIRALKARGLPVAGQDRMALTEPLAVRDLLALARFALLPDDDLTLACVLRSPLVGLSEDALFDLAHDRGGRLWRALVRRRAENEELARAHALLADMLAQADFLRPYEFFERALTRWDGRARLLGRLGREAQDPVDELLNQALAFEEAAIPTLQGFIDRLEGAEFQVKREMEQGGDEIRLLTAHGAKGLEAKIVFLPDTQALPPDRGAGLFDLDGAPVWSPRKAQDPAPVAARRAEARMREMAEYRRLLYVAMTRAEDWLILCGWHGDRAPRQGTWRHLAEPALIAGAQPIRTPLRDEAGAPVMGWAVIAEAPPDRPQEGEQLTLPLAPPRAALGPAPRESAPPPPVSPSRLGEEDPFEPTPPPGEDESAPEPALSSAERGTLIHDLLEALAPLSPQARRERGARILAARGGAGEALERALAILEDPAFAWMFGPESVAEAALAGAVAGLGGASVSGRIDRLAIRPEGVDVIDFKTGRRPSEPPEPYLRQLAVYAAALAEILPDRPVRAHLLWLDAHRLDTVDPDSLAAALSRARAAVDRAGRAS